MVNLILVKISKENQKSNQPADVCLWLIQPFLKNDYCMTIDKFFKV